MKTNKHGNIAIFVPHIGCPCRCSFCDQRAISGIQRETTAEDVLNACKLALSHNSKMELELAFFGGSFTAIDRDYMISLLDSASEFLTLGIIGIRISTRPDAINSEVLTLLKEKGVTAIELGAQSMLDSVLEKNNRGHLSAETVVATKQIREFGFSLGLQMMTGLYGSTKENDWDTACKIAELSPDTVRIYPTLTLEGTELANLFLKGEYIPQTLNESVVHTAKIMEKMAEHHIKVIRVGLHPSTELEKKIVAGPYHQAFRELCEGEILSNKILEIATETDIDYLVYVNPLDISKLTGHKKWALKKIEDRGIRVKIKTLESVDTMSVKVTVTK